MNPINPSECRPDEAYVGTVHGKRRIMVRCAQKDALGSSVWLVARPDWQSHEYVTDHMVSDLTRLVPYDRGGVPGPTWAERERDMWRDRYRALQSEYARQSQAWSEKRADYEARLAKAAPAATRDPVEERAREIETKVRDVLSGVMTPLAQITDSPAGVYLDDLIPDGWDREFYRDMARRALGEGS